MFLNKNVYNTSFSLFLNTANLGSGIDDAQR